MDSNLTAESRGQIGYYMLYNENTDQAYAGSGVLGERKSKHQSLLKAGQHHSPKLQAAYDADPNFKFIGVVVDEGSPELSREAAFACEQETINEHWGNPLFLNAARDVAGSRLGIPHREETKEVLSDIKKQQWQDPEWAAKVVEAQNAGKAAMTDEQLALRSQRLSQGIKASYDNGVRVSTAGQTRSAEFCERNSQQVKSLWEDPDYRARQSASKLGNRNAPMKQVVVGDTVYESKTAAAAAFGITKQSVSHRINSKTFPDWQEQSA